jgi:hypothetical protein
MPQLTEFVGEANHPLMAVVFTAAVYKIPVPEFWLMRTRKGYEPMPLVSVVSEIRSGVIVWHDPGSDFVVHPVWSEWRRKGEWIDLIRRITCEPRRPTRAQKVAALAALFAGEI